MITKLTPLQRIGISYLLLGILKNDKSASKGGRIYFKRFPDKNIINMYYACYNDLRYVFTLMWDEHIDDDYEYIVKFDKHSEMFHIIDEKEN